MSHAGRQATINAALAASLASIVAWVAPPEEVASKLAEVDDQTFDAVMSDFPAEWVHASIRARALKAYWRSYRKSSDPVRMLKLLMEVTELGAAPIRRVESDAKPART